MPFLFLLIAGALQEVSEPTKEEKAVAKYLRFNCPTKSTNMMGHRVDYFVGECPSAGRQASERAASWRKTLCHSWGGGCQKKKKMNHFLPLINIACCGVTTVWPTADFTDCSSLFYFFCSTCVFNCQTRVNKLKTALQLCEGILIMCKYPVAKMWTTERNKATKLSFRHLSCMSSG